jgi:acyl-CoA synthetase (AMP-forming)/AMP-acid ligase II
MQQWARLRPHFPAVCFLADGENESSRLSFGELDDKARRLSSRIIRAGLSGKTVLLPAESAPPFIIAMCGCLYSGAIAVPIPTQIRNRGEDRIRAIASNAGIAAVVDLGGDACKPLLQTMADIALISLDDLQAESRQLRPPDPSRCALLQYTSGSTSAAKGVLISHHNLATNIAMLSEAFGVHAESRFLTWLPLFHDMGLVGHLLAALYCGIQCTVIPPLRFLQKPVRWLKAISRYDITMSGGPNFAYDLCVRRHRNSEDDAIDLRSWERAVCAGEPVRLSTMRDFAETFAPFGFRKTALYPSYGLAEATVFVSGGCLGDGVKVIPTEVAAKGELISCGRPPSSTSVVIVDPDTCELLPDGAEGEVWVSGDHVATRYWNNATATAAVFAATLSNGQGSGHGKFLRTGDLGLKWQGELFVTGRRKNLIIHRGINLHPEDIEATIGSCHANFGVTGAAFAIDVNGEEQLVVAYEVLTSSRKDSEVQSMIERALKAVAQEHGVRIYDLVLTRSGTLPRTTSGKIQRDRCRALYLAKRLASIEGSFTHPSLGISQSLERRQPTLG